ncbi:MAG: PD-(D/E)XK nuclease family protein [Bacilli bacterium]|nr:PD-(D/E)XK nuclease family protein [Bacilli bacterium]
MQLIICNNSIKKKLLNESNSLINRKFMTMKEFINSYYFSYNEESICYLMNKYDYKYNVACVYLDNLLYIEDKEYCSDKLNFLVRLKKELDDNGLLIYDRYFKEYLKGKEIIIYSDYLNKFESHLIDELRSFTKVSIINAEYKEYKHTVYAFDSMDEEIDYVAYKICELISSGISINDIKLTNVSSDYLSTIDRVFKMYNIPIDINNEVIYGTNISNDFLKEYNSDISITINKLKEKYNGDILDRIIDICNKYAFVKDYNKVLDMIIHDLKSTSVPKKKLRNSVEIIDYKKDVIDQEYVFMIGFNQENIPTIYKDEDYISDNIKNGLLLDLTVDKNKMEKELTIKIIKSIKNLIITYKLKTPFSSFYPANLINELNFTTEHVEVNKLISYSKLNDRIKCSKMLDNLVKYGLKDNDLDLYYTNLKVDYMKYDNTFKGIDINTLYKFMNNKLLLSYTSMNNYFKCAFRYYLGSILKLDIFEESFATHLGSIFHHILEIGLDNDINIDEEIEKYISDNNIKLSVKDRFFLDKLKEELPNIISVIKEHEKNSELVNKYYEKEIEVDKSNKLNTIFKGFIDKVMYKDNIYALIDYKTGNTDIDLTLIPHGLNMQLPVYLYLARHMFPDSVFAGFYLQIILNGNYNYNSKLPINKQREDSLKLLGFSNSDKSILEMFDKTYESSRFIKSMRVKTDGEFYNYSKVLTNDEINNLIKLVDDKIDECIKNIEQGNFNINPKVIDNENVGCLYCKFKDICFMSHKDIVHLKKYEDLSFLGGEE